jgi:hypothetical protein
MTKVLSPKRPTLRLMLQALVSNETEHSAGCSFIREECLSCDCMKATAVALLKKLDEEAKTDD